MTTTDDQLVTEGSDYSPAPKVWTGTEEQLQKALEFMENIVRPDGVVYLGRVSYDEETQLFTAHAGRWSQDCDDPFPVRFVTDGTDDVESIVDEELFSELRHHIMGKMSDLPDDHPYLVRLAVEIDVSM
ncbi:hypothetical protein [Mycobacterium sp. E2733]|uniref:hypothetical protein n=1 Tax=Mycobacterium sp. E2733 TaxID=1834138 RepID=UPI0007FDA859|nr:hypothetical protein [Mycobacterium sp. E2733]OBH94282.1 hypothetical protein A5678_04450 [Mycobacterium sp. E2733]